MEASSSIPMPQTQGAGANVLSDNPEPKLCQFRCFGRSVSLTKRFAVKLSAYLSVGIPVAMSIAIPVGNAVVNNTAIRGAAVVFSAIAAGGSAGAAAGVAAWIVADRLYVKYRHVTPTFSPAELTQVTGHNPDAIDERTPLLTDRSGGETT